MEYTNTTEEQLGHLQAGLDILSLVSMDLVPPTLYLFGLLKPDSPALQYASEAVWEDDYAGEEREENIHINTAAVGIRLSSDVLHALLGSGLVCRDSDFVYILNGEIKSCSFSYAPTKPKITATDFSKLALSNDSFPIENFMRTEGLAQDKQNPGVITRTEKAVGNHPGGTGQLPQHEHKSSLKVYKDAADMLANWTNQGK